MGRKHLADARLEEAEAILKAALEMGVPGGLRRFIETRIAHHQSMIQRASRPRRSFDHGRYIAFKQEMEAMEIDDLLQWKAPTNNARTLQSVFSDIRRLLAPKRFRAILDGTTLYIIRLKDLPTSNEGEIAREVQTIGFRVAQR